MRRQLASEAGDRKKFHATFSRYGKKIGFSGYSEETILLLNIIDVANNQVVADHLWFSMTKGFEKLRLSEGDALEFDARIKEYSKGYVNKKYGINDKRRDYKLSNPSKIRIVGK